MTDYEVNCIMRVLAKFACSHITTSLDLCKVRDNRAIDRLYDCYFRLKPDAPITLQNLEIFTRLAQIDYTTAISVVRELTPKIKQDIVNCLLHMAQYQPITSFMGVFGYWGDPQENIMLLEEIAIEARIMTDNLRMIIKSEKDSL